MASNHNHCDGQSSGKGAAGRRAPEWADGLKQLYDSVVEEDLPDTFKDLLDQLDMIDGGSRFPGNNYNGSPTEDGQSKRR